MKTLQLLFSFLFISGLINAQQYQTIAIQSGFNADVIANGSGIITSTTDDIDDSGYALVAKGFQSTNGIPTSYGLPTTGLVNSDFTSGLTYQLASYSTNNALRLSSENFFGTLIFTTPTKAKTLYLLATSGSNSGSSTNSYVNIIVDFSDGSTQTFISVIIEDWYKINSYVNPVAVRGTGRVYRSTNALEYDLMLQTPHLYQISLPIENSNQSKNIKSVTFFNINPSSVANIFAVSADTSSTLDANEINAEKSSIIYPNPFDKDININNVEDVEKVFVIDLSGRVLKTVQKPSSVLDLGILKSGVYFINLTMKDGSVKTIKVTKKQ